jgi:tetratricopeptide (TPR) repeat protein
MKFYAFLILKFLIISNMMTGKKNLISLAVLAFLLSAGTVTGQTIKDVITAFNGIASRTDTIGKIKAMEDCIALCTKVGAPADSIKGVIGKALPAIYFKKASGLYKSQKYVESTAAYEEVVKVAQKYQDSLVAGAAKKNLTAIYYDLGNKAFDQKKDADAIKYYDKVLASNPQNIKATYYTTSAYKRLNNKVKFEEYLNKTLDLAKAANDSKVEGDANKMAKNFYLTNYANSYRLGKVGEAITNLNSALKYAPDDKELLYYIGQAYNTQKKFDLALENLNKGLELETGKPEDKAKFYYEIGQAYEGKLDNAKACSAYQNAMFGKFTDSAKAKRTLLKCK